MPKHRYLQCSFPLGSKKTLQIARFLKFTGSKTALFTLFLQCFYGFLYAPCMSYLTSLVYNIYRLYVLLSCLAYRSCKLSIHPTHLFLFHLVYLALYLYYLLNLSCISYVFIHPIWSILSLVSDCLSHFELRFLTLPTTQVLR